MESVQLRVKQHDDDYCMSNTVVYKDDRTGNNYIDAIRLIDDPEAGSRQGLGAAICVTITAKS